MGKLAAAGQSASRELFQIRCDRGAVIASGLGLSDATASAIRSMDEHWDGGGHPEGLRGDRIPLLARIVGLSQVAEIFGQNGGPQAAFDVVWKRRKRWFDPELVDGFRSVAADQAFWTSLRTADERQLLSGAEPVQSIVVADDKRLDTIAEAFASVIDAKSPFTADHSRRVSNIAVRISATLGYSAAAQQRLRRAALLHDIGKLGVPNSILDKPSALTGDEWTVVRKHPAYTYEILSRVPGFRDLAFDASCHHEKLDGSGYHQGLRAEALSQPARILAVADIADALLADRPYRRGLPAGETLSQLRSERERGALCGVCVEAAVQAVNVEVLSIDSRTRQASAAS
jgi:HD-GYP domain-containing protein (c-di-GMP phosphodiesterase class II)